MSRLNIPERYLFSTFENYQGKIGIKAGLTDKIAGKTQKNFFLIHGRNGTGKTHLAVASILFILQQTKVYYSRVKFIRLKHLIEKIKSAKDNANRTFSKQDFEKVKILIVDDLLSTSFDSWALDIFADILDTRYGNTSTLSVFTTDVSIQNLYEVFGKRIATRLTSGFIYETTGENRRLR